MECSTAPAAKLTKVDTFRIVYREVGQIIENNSELPDSEFFALIHDGYSVNVVTADRARAERVRETGAEVVGPSWLLDRFVE